VTELVVVCLQAGVAGSLFVTRLAVGSQAVRFLQYIMKCVTYAPHMTCSPGILSKRTIARGDFACRKDTVLRLQVIFKNVEKIVWKAVGTVAFAIFLHFIKHTT
jgi:hypothetical protein